jgi:hypothetical protein
MVDKTSAKACLELRRYRGVNVSLRSLFFLSSELHIFYCVERISFTDFVEIFVKNPSFHPKIFDHVQKRLTSLC